MTANVSPDCRDNHHGACVGAAWDHDNDQPTPCTCTCHHHEKGTSR